MPRLRQTTPRDASDGVPQHARIDRLSRAIARRILRPACARQAFRLAGAGGDACEIADPGVEDQIGGRPRINQIRRSEEHTSELQSLMRNAYAVFCLKKKKKEQNVISTNNNNS